MTNIILHLFFFKKKTDKRKFDEFFENNEENDENGKIKFYFVIISSYDNYMLINHLFFF